MADTNEKSIEAEQRDLSILLLQKVVKINQTLPLKTESLNFPKEHAVCAYIKNDKSFERLYYYIFHKLYTDEYYIRFDRHKNNIIRMGDAYSFWPNIDKGVFFRDENHAYNYLSAVYWFTYSSGFQYLTGFKERSAEAKRTIEHLMTLKPKPNLKGTKAWSAERMNLFPYLDTFLTKTKSS